MPDVAGRIGELAAGSRTALEEIYRAGAALGEAAIGSWRADAECAALLAGAPNVGIAVRPETFARIHAAWQRPRFAQVPADQDAREFELHADSLPGCVDVLTTRPADEPGAQGGRGAIARFLEKFGEGIQQVEYPCRDVAHATTLVGERFGLQPVYPQPRAGADGARVNFFLVSAPGGQKVLIELFEK
jgi:hypothetical protein